MIGCECGDMMRRHYKGYHLKHVCPEALVDCAFHEFGCVDKLKRKDEQKHYEDASCTHSHLKKIAKKQTELRETVDAQRAELDALKAKVDTFNGLQDEVASMKRQMQLLTGRSNANPNANSIPNYRYQMPASMP